MSVRYFKADTIRHPERLREGDVWTNKGLRFEAGEWTPYRKRSNALDNDWAVGEDEKLKAYFAAVYAGEDKRTLKDFAAELGRSPSACHTRAGKKLGILQEREIKGGFCTTPKWSEEEHAILDQWYPKVPIGEVMELLPGRSKAAIFARANERGLVSPYAQQYRGWTKAEQRALRVAYKRGLAIADLAHAVGRSPLTVSKYATNHGLDFGRRPLLAEGPTLELILSLEDESAPVPALLNRAAARPSRIAKRRPVVTDDKELRRREREQLAARRKHRRQQRVEERRREQSEAKAREKAARAAQRAAEVEQRRRSRKLEREIERARRAPQGRDGHTDRVNARNKQLAKRRIMARAEQLVAAGITSIGRGSPDLRVAVKIAHGLQENRARAQDPIEQAKLVLQRRGRVVHSMAVWGGRKDRFFVSGLGKDVTLEQLLKAATAVAA